MREKLSALLDGELDDGQTDALLAALSQDADLRREWQLYHLAGDVLRETGSTATSITRRVAERLADEPAHDLTPAYEAEPRAAISEAEIRHQRVNAVAANRGRYSLVASLAGVAFVAWAAWQSLAPSGGPAATQPLAAQTSVKQNSAGTQAVADNGRAADSRASDYWVAHRQLSGHMADSNDSGIEFVSVGQANEGSE